MKTPVSSPRVTVRAPNLGELVSAVSKKAEQLSTDTTSDHVLVVYDRKGAKIFCALPHAAAAAPRKNKRH